MDHIESQSIEKIINDFIIEIEFILFQEIERIKSLDLTLELNLGKMEGLNHAVRLINMSQKNYSNRTPIDIKIDTPLLNVTFTRDEAVVIEKDQWRRNNEFIKDQLKKLCDRP